NGNKTAETWYNSNGSVAANLTFTYDNNGRQLTAENANGKYTVTYDSKGEVLTARDMFGNLLTFSYDSVGHRTKVQDNFGGVLSVIYDGNGNVTQELFGGVSQTPLRADLSYD